MAKSSLFPQFVETFQTSHFYKELNDEEIEMLMNGYSDADDEQILLAIDTISSGDKKIDEAKNVPVHGLLSEAQLTEQLKAEIKAFDREVLKFNSDQDMSDSAVQAEQMLVTFESEKNVLPKKRKKFLGLF